MTNQVCVIDYGAIKIYPEDTVSWLEYKKTIKLRRK